MYLNHVDVVCEESDAGRSMDKFSITVIIETDSSWALTAVSMTHMTSLIWILLDNLVINKTFLLWLNSNWQTAIEQGGCLTAKSGSQTFDMVCLTHAPVQINYQSHNVVTEIKKILTGRKIGKHIAVHRHMISQVKACVSIFPQMKEQSPCFRPHYESISCLVGGYIQMWKLTGSSICGLSIGDELGSAECSRPCLLVFNCSLPEPSIMWQFPGRDVLYSICDILYPMLKHIVSTVHVVGAGGEVSSYVWIWNNAGTLNWDGWYCLSDSRNDPASSSHPGSITSLSFICIWWNLFFLFSAVLLIVPITQPGSSSSHCLPYSVSSSSSWTSC